MAATPERSVEKSACDRSRAAVHVPGSVRQVRDGVHAERIAGRDEEALLSDDEPHDGDVASGKHLITVRKAELAGLGVDQLRPGDVRARPAAPQDRPAGLPV